VTAGSRSTRRGPPGDLPGLSASTSAGLVYDRPRDVLMRIAVVFICPTERAEQVMVSWVRGTCTRTKSDSQADVQIYPRRIQLPSGSGARLRVVVQTRMLNPLAVREPRADRPTRSGRAWHQHRAPASCDRPTPDWTRAGEVSAHDARAVDINSVNRIGGRGRPAPRACWVTMTCARWPRDVDVVESDRDVLQSSAREDRTALANGPSAGSRPDATVGRLSDVASSRGRSGG